MQEKEHERKEALQPMELDDKENAQLHANNALVLESEYKYWIRI